MDNEIRVSETLIKASASALEWMIQDLRARNAACEIDTGDSIEVKKAVDAYRGLCQSIGKFSLH